jgi:hypothetical protein
MLKIIFKWSGFTLIQLVTLLLIFTTHTSIAQTAAISFRSNISQSLKPEALLDLTINSKNAQDIKVYIEGTINSKSGFEVVHFQTVYFNIHQGINITTQSELSFISIRYVNDEIKTVVAKTGSLPANDYIYCVNLIRFEGQGIAKACGEINIKGSALELISPYNGEHVTILNPVLMWHGSLAPVNPGDNISYGVKLVEVNSFQSPVSAFMENPVLLDKNNINAEALLYPADARPLEKGKIYAWQVTAYLGQNITGKTEIWFFCIDSIKNNIINTASNSYVILKKNVDGGLSYFINDVKFKVTTNDLGENPVVKIFSEQRKDITPENLKINQEYGENLYTIDLTSYPEFKKNTIYTLELRTGRNELYVMKFKYEKKHVNGKKNHILIKKDF